MKLILKYIKPYLNIVALGMGIKLLGTIGELSLPYILEHIMDRVVPTGELLRVILWGLLMILMAVLTRTFNVYANRTAARASREAIYDLRKDLFAHTANLNGTVFDSFGLPSLTSRMTSDSYNVQNFIVRMQTLGVRGPIMLIGGTIITLIMDWRLAMILIISIPILMAGVFTVSVKGTPLYDRVQTALDEVVRIMRENISGIRVVKALSREHYEEGRFAGANEDFTKKDIHANAVMALPGPFMQLCLNTGLTVVIIVGARLVNAGITQPGVILAFLTYFNLILMAVMGLNRIFVMYSKAAASADRIALVLDTATDLPVMDESAGETASAVMQDAGGAGAEPAAVQTKDFAGDYEIVFDHVTFTYDVSSTITGAAGDFAAAAPRGSAKEVSAGTSAGSAGDSDVMKFGGGVRRKCLEDISFRIRKGESLGIIGATGAGKTTVINLLMRFYDADEGSVYVAGKDVRTYDKDDLHRKFGVVFQNDIIFADTLEENIRFGRRISDEDVKLGAVTANADGFIEQKEGGYKHMAAIKGANLSGGQKQRMLIARAVAGRPEILVLDDASSALDYRTDAMVRKAIRENYGNTTMVMIAQRISSVMNLDHILVLEDGRMLDYGKHGELMERCNTYREIYESQMGDI